MSPVCRRYAGQQCSDLVSGRACNLPAQALSPSPSIFASLQMHFGTVAAPRCCYWSASYGHDTHEVQPAFLGHAPHQLTSQRFEPSGIFPVSARDNTFITRFMAALRHVLGSIASNRERKFADSIGTVLVMGWPFPMLKYKYIFRIKYT